MKKLCQSCNQKFDGRRDAKTCTTRCRKRLQRLSNFAVGVTRQAKDEARAVEHSIEDSVHQMLQNQDGFVNIGEISSQPQKNVFQPNGLVDSYVPKAKVNEPNASALEVAASSIDNNNSDLPHIPGQQITPQPMVPDAQNSPASTQPEYAYPTYESAATDEQNSLSSSQVAAEPIKKYKLDYKKYMVGGAKIVVALALLFGMVALIYLIKARGNVKSNNKATVASAGNISDLPQTPNTNKLGVAVPANFEKDVNISGNLIVAGTINGIKLPDAFGGQAVLLAPGSAQTDNAVDVSIFINDTGGGNLLQMQSGGVDRFVVSNTGNITSGTINGQTISSAANLTGTLAVAGNVTGGTYNGQTISSTANLTGTLAVAGAITSGTINGQTVSSAASLTGTLNVAGNTTLVGDLAVNGGDITTAGAQLNITGANGNGGIGGVIAIQGGNAGTGGFNGGGVNITGGTGTGLFAGGNITIAGGTAFAGGAVNIDGGVGSFGTGSVNVANTTTIGALNVGAAFTSGTITLGGTAQTGLIVIGQATTASTAIVNILSSPSTASTQTINIAGNSSTTSGGKVVNIANGVPGAGTTNTVGIGTGGSTTGTVGVTIGSVSANSHTTTIQGGNGTTAVSINSASGGTINLGNGAVANTVQIGNTTGAVAQTINIGNNTTGSSVGTVLIGSTIGAGVTNLQAGSGAVNVTSGTLKLGVGSTTNGALVLQNATNAFGVTLSASNQTTGSATIALPNTSGVGDTFCLLTLANCTGTGSSSTLQAAYNADTDGSDAIISLTTADDSLIFRNPSSSGTDSGYIALFDQLNTGAIDSVQINNAGTGDLLELQDSGTAVLRVTDGGHLTANGVATATTGTTEGTARTNVTAITLTTDAFSVNDVIFFNNVGQDYYTRVTVDNANGTYTVSPAVSYDATITVTKYNIQNIGATATDYSTLSNRFFQGYFLGGVVTGAGSTTLSDGNLSSSGNLVLQGTGGNVGIGTTNPVGALNVVGAYSSTLNIDKVGGSNRLQLFVGAGTGGYTADEAYLRANNSAINFRTGLSSTDTLSLRENGNVGIGTVSPQQALTLGSAKNFAVEMAAPGTITDTGSITGGTLAAGTYFHKVTALDGVGETVGSAESTCTVASGTTGSCAMSWTAITGASSYNIYRTTTSGTYGATSLVATSTTNSYTDTGSALTSGTVPGNTTAYVNKLTANGASWLLGGNVGIGDSTPLYQLTVGSGDLFGVNSSGNVIFSDTAHTISVLAETTANTVGNSLTVSAGAANGSTTGAVGGDLALKAGDAAGSGNNDGGAVTIDGGAKTGSGNVGSISLQSNGTGGSVRIGNSTFGGRFTVSTGSASTAGQQIRGVGSQTAALLKFGDNSSNMLGEFIPQAAGNQRIQFNIYRTLETTVTNYERLAQYADNTNSVYRIEAQNGGTGTLLDLVLQGGGGKVGIGTASPGTKLDISGGIARENGYALADAATNNLLVNGDFEQGDIYGWSIWQGSGPFTVVTGGYSGNRTSQITGNTNILSDDYIPVDPKYDVVELDAWLKKSVNGTTPGKLYFGYVAYDANKTVITTAPCGVYCYFAAENYTFPDNNWHRFQATTTGEGTSAGNFPVGTRYVRVLGLINNGGSADTVTQMDHVILKKVNNGPLYVGNNFTSTNLTDQNQVTQLYTTSANNFIITPPSSGNVGIGTAGPGFRLDVQDNQSTTYVAQIKNINTATTADGLLIDLGVANASRGVDNYFVGFSGAGTVAGKIQGGASAVTYTTTGTDYAEYFPIANLANPPEYGDLVMMAPDRSADKATQSGGSVLVGVVSNKAGFVGNGPICRVEDNDCDNNYMKYNSLVGMIGQLPTKVSTENGPIAAGDPITASSVPGVGMKATGAGRVVGFAQENYNAAGIGRVSVYINPTWYEPPAGQQLQTGSNTYAQNGSDASFSSLNVSGATALASLHVTGDASFDGTLTVRTLVVTDSLTVNGHLLSEGMKPQIEKDVNLGRDTEVLAANVEIDGNDTAGTITLIAGENANNGVLAKVLFGKVYEKTPRIVLSAINKDGLSLPVFARKVDGGFEIVTGAIPQAGKTYQFDYIIVGSAGAER